MLARPVIILRNFLSVMVIGACLGGCGAPAFDSSRSDALNEALEILQENEAEIIETRQGLQNQLDVMTLKDPARFDVLEQALRCKKVLDKIGFTRRQFKRRLKVLKKGGSVPPLTEPLHFRCD